LEVSILEPQGVGSLLCVPLELEGESSAALNIYSSAAFGFCREDMARAELFGEQSAKTLRLELRLTQLRDVAAGVIHSISPDPELRTHFDE
jgi:hypothetical protein